MDNFNLFGILFIIIFHWFADYVMQKGEWAVNKSSSIEALFNHVSMYSVLWIPFSIFIAVYLNKPNIIYFFPVTTFICHLITDYFTSKKTSKEYKAKNFGNKIPRGFDFFVTLGFDQVLHYIQLILTFYFLTK